MEIYSEYTLDVLSPSAAKALNDTLAWSRAALGKNPDSQPPLMCMDGFRVEVRKSSHMVVLQLHGPMGMSKDSEYVKRAMREFAKAGPENMMLYGLPKNYDGSKPLRFKSTSAFCSFVEQACEEIRKAPSTPVTAWAERTSGKATSAPCR